MPSRQTAGSFIYAVILFFIVSAPIHCFSQLKQRSQNFFVKAPEEIYLGAVIDAKRFNEPSHEIFNIIDDEITVSFLGILIKSFKVQVGRANLDKIVKAKLDSVGNKPFEQNLGFTFNVAELEDYIAIDRYFGQTVDKEGWFGIKANQKQPKTLLAVDMRKTSFNLVMDVPYSGKFKFNKDEREIENMESLVYVNTLSFGRRIFALVESELDVSIVRPAITKLAQQKDLAEEDAAVIANCKFSIANFTGEELAVDSENPLKVAMDFVGQNITTQHYGVPIGFTASYIHNNGGFENQFD